MNLPLQAALTGEAAIPKQRIGRLLDPLPADSQEHRVRSRLPALTLLPTLLVAMALGLIFGERVVRTLFWIATDRGAVLAARYAVFLQDRGAWVCALDRNRPAVE